MRRPSSVSEGRQTRVPCPECGAPRSPRALVCPTCGSLTGVRRGRELARVLMIVGLVAAMLVGVIVAIS
jgi:uncharacterized OB-fold protein